MSKDLYVWQQNENKDLWLRLAYIQENVPTQKVGGVHDML